MGLTNAPTTFQHYIQHTLRGYLDTFTVVYLDDILIFSPDRESHTQHLRQVIKRLREADLYCNPNKYEFYKDQVKFLSYVVGKEGISIDSARIQTVLDWPKPQSFHDIQVFIGFCNFFRRFVQGFSEIARPLYDMLKGIKNGRKSGNVRLGDEERASFQRLK